tara:strand:+ start:210 stop:395 length:186 start_codon:yes stop_codon:yes gene_type:complete
MRNDYNNPLDQMKAISWQLKRIADVLERQFPTTDTNTNQQMTEKSKVDSSKLQEFLRGLEG